MFWDWWAFLFWDLWAFLFWGLWAFLFWDYWHFDHLINPGPESSHAWAPRVSLAVALGHIGGPTYDHSKDNARIHRGTDEQGGARVSAAAAAPRIFSQARGTKMFLIRAPLSWFTSHLEGHLAQVILRVVGASRRSWNIVAEQSCAGKCCVLTLKVVACVRKSNSLDVLRERDVFVQNGDCKVYRRVKNPMGNFSLDNSLITISAKTRPRSPWHVGPLWDLTIGP